MWRWRSTPHNCNNSTPTQQQKRSWNKVGAAACAHLQQVSGHVHDLLVSASKRVVHNSAADVGGDAVQPNALHNGVVAVAAQGSLALLLSEAHAVLHEVKQAGCQERGGGGGVGRVGRARGGEGAAVDTQHPPPVAMMGRATGANTGVHTWCKQPTPPGGTVTHLDPLGSARNTRVLGLCAFRAAETPATVPPVPAPMTNASTGTPAALHWARISGPVPSKWHR